MAGAGQTAVNSRRSPDRHAASRRVEEEDLTVEKLTDLLAALEEAVGESDTLLLLDRSPPDESRSASITVGQEDGKEEPRLSVTFDPDSGQAVFRGVYWRSGEFTPAMRERHSVLFNPAVFRLDEDGCWLSDPRPGVAQGDDAEVECYDRTREAAAFLLELLEHHYGMVRERSD